MKSGRRSLLRSTQASQRGMAAKGSRPFVARKKPSTTIDVEKLLHFSQQLYAHALTLQEMIRNGGNSSYEILRPRCYRQAARQFEIFYDAFGWPAGDRLSRFRERSSL